MHAFFTSLQPLLVPTVIVSIFQGFIWYFGYRGKRAADVRRTDGGTKNVEWNAYKEYSEKLEKRMDALEEKYQKQIEGLQKLLNLKDGEIANLQEKVAHQAQEIHDLRNQVNDNLAASQNTAVAKAAEVDSAKTDLHNAVDDNLDKLKP